MRVVDNQGRLKMVGIFSGSASGGGLSNPVTPAQGGTGRTSLTPVHGVLTANGTGNVNVVSPGTTGQVLTSNGAGADPTMQAPAAGGAMIDSDIFANLPPVMGNTGNVFLPTDGFSLYRDDGTAWRPFGPLFPFVQPDDSTFTWVNQGSLPGASTDSTRGPVILFAPANAGQDNLRGRARNVPGSTPWSCTAFLNFSHSGADFSNAGIFVTDGTRITTIGVSNDTSGLILFCGNWNSVISFNNFTANKVVGWPMPSWWKIRNDGTFLSFEWSADGNAFVPVSTVTVGSWLSTITQYGWFCNTDTNDPAYATLYSWEEGT